jgi:hypothetical protein
VTDHCGCWRCAPKPECQKCEALAEPLRKILYGMEASGGWDGDEDLYSDGIAALAAYEATK